ncbi:MAG TPA: hypothetical protein VMQ73_01160 [Methylomirabilota bacterium]|nr:hypothetical protein [Methylomirabilota bacterium]
MGCCGNRRLQARATGPATPGGTEATGTVQRRAATAPEVVFQYVGTTGLTVQGPITGRHYRFASPGARVAVDGRDAPSVRGVPNLRLVPGTD